MGRRTILTDKLIGEICGMIREGAIVKDACEAVGICDRSYHTWREKGEAEKPVKRIYARFAQELARAEADFRRHHINIIRRAAEEPSVETTVQVFQEGKPGEPGFKEVRRKTERRIPPDPSHSKWLLERKFPDEFGRSTRVQHEGKIDNPSAGAPVGVTVNLVFDQEDDTATDEAPQEPDEGEERGEAA